MVAPARRMGRGALLERVLELETLRQAWLDVRRNRGSAGGDGVSLKRFGHLVDHNLLQLADDVRDGDYRPRKVRRVPITSGGKERVITVLPIRDRVLQRAALDILTPIVDPWFLKMSYGYRPGRSLHDAVERIVKLRDNGRLWVVDADIADCFGSLDHTILRQYLERVVPDPALVDLLSLWMDGDATSDDGDRGIDLGAVISPLFCNLYLHQFDVDLVTRRYHPVRYADDFVLLCKSREEAERALRTVMRLLKRVKLRVNREKTSICHFDDGFDFLGVHFEGYEYSYTVDDKLLVFDGPWPHPWSELVPPQPEGYV